MEKIRLNKYIARTGVGSRKKVDTLIREERVQVNGEVVREMGLKIDPEKDVVHLDGQKIDGHVPTYLLLNKPSGYGGGGRELKQLLAKEHNHLDCIGAEDEGLRGLHLFSNDKEIFKRFSHSTRTDLCLYHVQCIHKVVNVTRLEMLLRTEDASFRVNVVPAVEGHDAERSIGIQCNILDSSILRKAVSQWDNEVERLDRVLLAGLSKKRLPRSEYRELNAKEIAFLRMI